MNVLEQANYRMKNREWEDGVKERRAAEFRAALERLDEAEYRASFPDNENRVRELEQIRRTRAEITAMMDQEFGLSEQYKQIAGS